LTKFTQGNGDRLEVQYCISPQTDGQSERLNQILGDMLRACVLDFKGSWIQYLPLIEFAYNNSYQATIGMPPNEALCEWKCQSPMYWSKVGEQQLLEPEIIQDTKDKIVVIRKRIVAAQSRQKSYVDKQRRALEFEVEDQVFLKLLPMKGVMQFGKKGKLSPRFIGPFEVTQRVGKLAYRVDLPLDLAGTHDVFHVSMLLKYIPNLGLVVKYEPLGIEDELTYEEKPIKILDRKELVL